MLLETGDILLEKGRGIVPSGIKMFTKSEYSHVAMVYDYPLIIHSHLFSGVHISNIDVLDECDIYRVIGGLSKSDKQMLKDKSIVYLGMRYDLFQIFGFIIDALVKGENKFNNPDLIICSELIDRLFMTIRIDLLKEMFLGDVTPEELSNSDVLELIVRNYIC